MEEQSSHNDVTTTEKIVATTEQKNLAQLVYILQAVAIIIGITSIAGVIVNYLKRDSVAGTYIESHFTWQIKTFWFTLAGFILGAILLSVFIGKLVWFLTGLWYVYRVVKGWLALSEGKPVADEFF